MDLKQVQCFVATARAGTYAAASQRLLLAQPAVWKHVDTLGRELGVSLFERTGRQVQLTPAGRSLLEPAEHLLEGAQRIQDFALELREGRSGTVTVGCVGPHVIGFLAPVIGEFHRRHPGVRIVLREVEFDRASPPPGPFAEALSNGAVDIVTGEAVPGTEHFRLYEVSVICAVPPRHPWRNLAAVDVEQLRDVPILASPPGFFSRSTLEAACRASGFHPHIAIDNANPSVLVELGRHGLGVPVLANDAVHTARPRQWPIVHARGQALSAPTYLSSRPTTSPAVTAFVELAREAAAQRS